MTTDLASNQSPLPNFISRGPTFFSGEEGGGGGEEGGAVDLASL